MHKLRTVTLLLFVLTLFQHAHSQCDTGCDEDGCCLTACVTLLDGTIYIDYYYSGNCGGSGGWGGGGGGGTPSKYCEDVGYACALSTSQCGDVVQGGQCDYWYPDGLRCLGGPYMSCETHPFDSFINHGASNAFACDGLSSDEHGCNGGFCGGQNCFVPQPLPFRSYSRCTFQGEIAIAINANINVRG